MSGRILLFSLGLSCVMLFNGCAGLKTGPAPQVPLSSAGLEANLGQLRANQDAYSIHYSLNRQNPPAVIFIPKKSEYTLKLIDRGVNRWYQVESPDLLTQVIRRIRDNRFGSSRFPALQALVTPPGEDGRNLLAYIYSKGHASLSTVEGKGRTFALRPVPPQKNLKFNNRNGGSGGNGAQ